jgi:hypothetical protein
MATTTFQGPVRSLGGIFQQGPDTVVPVTASTEINPTDHGGRIVSAGGALAANVVLTLPAINIEADPVTAGPGRNPSTSNNLGVTYTIMVPTTITGNSLKIGTNGTDKFVGSVSSIDTDSGNAMIGFVAGANNDFINLNGGTTGGIAGTIITIVAVAANKYMVTGVVLGSGVVATPFADA